MSNQSTRDILAKYGLANSAFGARTIAEETAAQNQNVANVPANTTEQILSQAPSVALGASGEGFGGLGTAGGLDINRKFSTNSSQQSYWGNITDPNSSAVGGAEDLLSALFPEPGANASA